MFGFWQKQERLSPSEIAESLLKGSKQNLQDYLKSLKTVEDFQHAAEVTKELSSTAKTLGSDSETLSSAPQTLQEKIKTTTPEEKKEILAQAESNVVLARKALETAKAIENTTREKYNSLLTELTQPKSSDCVLL